MQLEVNSLWIEAHLHDLLVHINEARRLHAFLEGVSNTNFLLKLCCGVVAQTLPVLHVGRILDRAVVTLAQCKRLLKLDPSSRLSVRKALLYQPVPI